MSNVTLVLGQHTFTASLQTLVNNCTLFAANPALAYSPYPVRTPVSPSVFSAFLRAVEGNNLSAIEENVFSQAQLCCEFGVLSHVQREGLLLQGSDYELLRINSTNELSEQLRLKEHRLSVAESHLQKFGEIVNELVLLRNEFSVLRSSIQSTLCGFHSPVRVESISSGRSDAQTSEVGSVSVSAIDRAKAELSLLRSEFCEFRTEVERSVESSPISPVEPESSIEPSTLGEGFSVHIESQILSSLPSILANYVFPSLTELKVKCAVSGAVFSGCTFLCHHLVYDEFNSAVPSGNDLPSFVRCEEIQGVRVRLTLIDTNHMDRYRSCRKNEFRRAQAAVFVLNLHDSSSWDSMANYIDEFRDVCAPEPCMVLAGTKADLPFDKQVLEEAQAIGTQNGMPMFITSALTGEGVRELFQNLCEMVVAREYKFCRFELLWRGSRDGFGAQDFHKRCDGHAPTITLIRDLNGNIFGGFTRISWESPFRGKMKEDPTNETIVFTLKNPWNCAATIFGQLRPSSAIRVDRKRGPCFGDGVLMISDDCGKQKNESGKIEVSFHNDTGYDGTTLLTGSSTFHVSEIEVLELHTNPSDRKWFDDPRLR
jgi:GTPase SAR1 family protein